MNYKILFTKEARKDFDLVKTSKYKTKVKELLEIVEKDPFQTPPPFERLKGSLFGNLSRRINVQHRLVYTVDGDTVIIKAMWTHYESI